MAPTVLAVEELAGVAEVAKMLGGVTRQRVHQITREYSDFPEPVATLESGRIWHADDIRRWIEAHPERRPKK